MTSMRPQVDPTRSKSPNHSGFTGRRGGSASEGKAIQPIGLKAIYYCRRTGPTRTLVLRSARRPSGRPAGTHRPGWTDPHLAWGRDARPAGCHSEPGWTSGRVPALPGCPRTSRPVHRDTGEPRWRYLCTTLIGGKETEVVLPRSRTQAVGLQRGQNGPVREIRRGSSNRCGVLRRRSCYSGLIYLVWS
jgi:hypothetical protein